MAKVTNVVTNEKKVDKQVVKDIENSNLVYYDFNYTGLGYDAGWAAWYDFELQMGEPNDPTFDQLMEFMKCGPWDCIFFKEAAIVSARPEEVHLDENNRLHNPYGPAVKWKDGYKNYFIHGMSVPADWIENPQNINANRVLRESNVELRRVLMHLMGMEKFMIEAKAQVVDEWIDGGGQPCKLLRLETSDDEPYQVYQFKDPSTGKTGILRVSPDVKTCKEAVASTFQQAVEIYNPSVET